MLTPIQIQIFRNLIEGMTFKEIGYKLSKSPFTVNNEVVRVRRKIGASNNANAIYLLTKQGVL